MSPRSVANEFKRLVDSGVRLRVSGHARTDPSRLIVARAMLPRHKIELFDTRFYLTGVFQVPELRFYVGYVVQKNSRNGRDEIFPRVIYKDLSLAWRSASHFTFVGGHLWMGKGDVKIENHGGHETVESIEATTDMPLEMQTSLEGLLGRAKRAANGGGIIERILRQGPEYRVEPYQDFTRPRELAASNPRNRIYRGRSIATFSRKNDPKSLRIAKGFEPDFSNAGIVERSHSMSKLYGGKLRRFRILSKNRTIQYYFFAGASHVWLMPPQAMTTQLSSYGVRTVDVTADDDLFVPGYEYHHYEDTRNGVELYSQIPPGFAGDTCPVDEDKADASPWLNKIPLIRKFRKEVLEEG